MILTLHGVYIFILGLMTLTLFESQRCVRNINCKLCFLDSCLIIIIIIIINPLTARVVGAPQMILQPVFSIFPCSLLPPGTCGTPGLSIS